MIRTSFALALTFAAVVALPRPARVAEPPRDQLDAVIERALDYLQNKQDADGAWRHSGMKSPAATALGVMAFLSSGHLPGEGRYGATVERGIRYVLSCQEPNGLFAARGHGGHEMYHHGICTLMLAEVSGMTDGDLADEIRRRLEKAVALILRAQRLNGERGGWRYRIEGYDSDLSVTGWQLLALRAAKNLGCDVPQERIQMAVDYVLRCHNRSSGAFCYQPNSRATVPCTGTGILCLELCGQNMHQCEQSRQAGAYIVRAYQRNGGIRGGFDNQFFYYGIYYCSQATFQLGENYWRAFRPEMHKILFRSQNADGSWYGRGYEGQIGPAYSTAMAVLALTVEYRFLPIYQRDEGAAEKP